ncbi:MAG: glycosyltransferase family 4 protein [Sphaerobacter sp.]|nr:glycosyltransferase family 4 protein [Sphaerobacter sp.]
MSFMSAEYCIRLASALAHDMDVQLVLPRALSEPYRSLISPAVQFVPFDKPRLRQPFRQISAMRQLVRQIDEFQPDVLHLQQGHLWFNLALPLLRRYPLVLTVHDARHHPGDRSSQKTPQVILDWGFRRATRVIAHCDWMKQVLVDECGVAAPQVHVIQRVLVSHDEDGTHETEEPALVLFFGRIWSYKGLEYLIRAEPLITAAIPEARIVIAGEGEDFSRYRRLMVHPDRFEVHNTYVSHEQRAALFAQASVVVLPYVEASQSGVIPLAYMAGKPVVATDVGCLPALVEDGHTGFLVPPHDEQALAAAVIRLLKDPQLRRTMGQRGRHKLETECAPPVVAAQTRAVYDQAVSDMSASSGKVDRPWMGSSKPL